MLYNLDQNGRRTWASSIRELLGKFGFGHVWVQQGVGNVDIFLNVFKLRVTNYYISVWKNDLRNSSQLAVYSSFKNELVCQQYLNVITIRKYATALARIRCSNHPLAIETGRYSGNEISERVCEVCRLQKNLLVLEDEYHLTLHCETYKELREKYIIKHTNGAISFDMFIVLMSSQDKTTVYDIACFFFNALKLRRDTLEGYK